MSQQKTFIANTIEELDQQYNEFCKGKKTWGAQLKAVEHETPTKEKKIVLIETVWYTLDWTEKK